MSKTKLICGIFLVMLFALFNTFSVSAVNVNITQSAAVTKHRSPNPNSEFVSNSFSTLNESFSLPSFSLPKEKGKFSKHSSISEESSFSSKPSFKPASNSGKFTKTSFSVHDDTEFSSHSSSMPKHRPSEFSQSSMAKR